MKKGRLLSMFVAAAMVFSFALPVTIAEGSAYYVALSGSDENDGSQQHPWKTIGTSLEKLRPGDTLYIMEGVYSEAIEVFNVSGDKDAPIRVTASEGAEVVIDGGGEENALRLMDCENIIIEGLCVTNAQYGIGVFCTDARSDAPLLNIVIRNNRIYGIDGPKGGHGISVYGENSLFPIENLIIEGNDVYMNRLYWSEAVVVNGNIDGFLIRGNRIYNNNNIGIDMIGFEGTADNAEVDFARNGKVYENIVFGSNTNGNEAYWSEDDEAPFGGYYDRCCDGIYVDGASHIEVYNNFLFDNDIGIEVATEHEPPCSVTDVYVHDNIVLSSGGWAGICFGGYESGLGYTEGCRFENNTLYGNEVGIAIQNSRDNIIKGNVIVGGWAAIECDAEEFGEGLLAANTFSENIWQNADDSDEYYDGLDALPEAQRDLQITATDYSVLADPDGGDFSLNPAVPEGFGTAYSPGDEPLSLYASFLEARDLAEGAAEFLQSKELDFAEAEKAGNLRSYLTASLLEAGFADTEVLLILKAESDDNGIVALSPDLANGEIDAAKLSDAEPGRYAYLAQIISKYGGAYAQRLTDEDGIIVVK